MKELRRKTNLTIIFILSIILVVVLVLLNVRSYTREQEDIRRSLNMLDNRMGPRNGFGRGMDVPGEPPKTGNPEKDFVPGGPIPPEGISEEPQDMGNLMILDHELYVVEVQDGAVSNIYSLGNTSEDFDVETAAEEILAKESKDAVYAENLYFGGYSYQYHYDRSIVILNNAESSKKLRELMLESLLLLIVAEGVIVLLARLITHWITKPAEEAFARQKEFIADASHELKTPLAVIMASADEMQAPETQQKYLENIRYEADRMSRLIAGLLNLSKLENGEDIASYKEENLSRILEKTCLAYEGVAFEQGVLIDMDIEEEMILKCNKDEMEQMAATLLDNAVRHSHKDSTVRMKAEYNRKKGLIQIDVINCGDPIPAEDEEKIFERFYRADKSRSRSENRYGLGLAIARRIARNHNGDIRAHSENGETIFHVELRRA